MKYVRYIEAPGGNKTQLIDTGYPFTLGSRIEMSCRVFSTVFTNWQPIFGCRTNTPNYVLYSRANGQNAFLAETNNTVRSPTAMAIYDKDIDITADKDSFAWTDGTDSYSISIALSGDCTETLKLFAVNFSGGTSDESPAMRLYSCKIYDGSTLVRDFRPALDDNGVAGLYDEITQSFFYNQGSGTFEYPYQYDKASFLAGLAVGRMLWRPPEVERHPPESRVFKQIYATRGYKITWTGRRGCILEWVAGGNPPIYDEGVVFQPGLGQITLTGENNGYLWQWGTCNQYGVLPDIIHSGANRISYTNGTPNNTLQAAAPNTVFCGTAFGPPFGVVYKLTISWENVV